jgi:hydrogenase maturation protease HycI
MNPVRGLLTEALKAAQTVAVLGCGSVLRGDDAAGMAVAERLSGLGLSELGLSGPGGNLRAYCGSNAPENFTGEIKKFQPDALVLVDAAHMGLMPGEAAVIAPDGIDGVSFSTHILPLKIMLEYLRREIGCRAFVLGIQGASYGFGDDMTPEVQATVDAVVDVFVEWAKERGIG